MCAYGPVCACARMCVCECVIKSDLYSTQMFFKNKCKYIQSINLLST